MYDKAEAEDGAPREAPSGDSGRQGWRREAGGSEASGSGGPQQGDAAGDEIAIAAARRRERDRTLAAEMRAMISGHVEPSIAHMHENTEGKPQAVTPFHPK